MPTAGPIAFALSPILAACVFGRSGGAARFYTKSSGLLQHETNPESPTYSGEFFTFKSDLNPIWSLLSPTSAALEQFLLPRAAMPNNSVKMQCTRLSSSGWVRSAVCSESAGGHLHLRAAPMPHHASPSSCHGEADADRCRIASPRPFPILPHPSSAGNE